MTRNKASAILVLVTLGALMHLAFRGLSTEISEKFPRTVDEAPQEILFSEPLTFEEDVSQDESDDFYYPPRSEPRKIAQPAEKTPTRQDPPQEDPALKNRLVVSGKIPEIPTSRVRGSRRFEATGVLEPLVDFWKKVYGVYDEHRVMIHDTDFLEIQYDVLDFTKLDQSDLPDSEKKATKSAEISRAMGRIKDLLTELDQAKTPEAQATLSLEALQVSQLFNSPEYLRKDPERFARAKDRLRTQGGLRTRFVEGLKRSGRYMPFFEKIFEGYGVPREISRLVFVESLFHERALSKVGAGGLWQFMPDSAKHYMVVNSLIDQRYDPIVATHGAARLLAHNYDLLGTWPLAINAYNSGPGNLLKAISSLGTKDIGTIIRKYKGGSYAFASRNFYPSFLAALDVYENQEAYFGKIEKAPLIQFDLVHVPITTTFPEIASLADTSIQELKALNPSFSSAILEGSYSLSPGSQVRVPTGREQVFAANLLARSTGIANVNKTTSLVNSK